MKRFVHFQISYFSYKEDSATATDSDDILEWKDEVKESPKNDAETIERIIRCRRGKKGGS